MDIDLVDEAVTTAATRTMGGGSVMGMIGYITSTEGIAVLGLLLAGLGFFVNWIFQLRRDIRESELHKARLRALAQSRADDESI